MSEPGGPSRGSLKDRFLGCSRGRGLNAGKAKGSSPSKVWPQADLSLGRPERKGRVGGLASLGPPPGHPSKDPGGQTLVGHHITSYRGSGSAVALW